jgi:tetratricopeptide (TPR) repeat protein
LGTIFTELKNFSKAKKYLELAIKNPEQESATCLNSYLNLATVLIELYKNNFTTTIKEKIISCYKKSYKADPNNSIFGLGGFYIINLKDFQNGLMYLEKAAKNKFLPAILQLAAVYYKKEYPIFDPQKAATYYELAATLGDPLLILLIYMMKVLELLKTPIQHCFGMKRE